MIVRDFDARDAALVRDVLTAAFPGAAEADLVEQLRGDGDAAIELVAEDGGAVVGHVLLSRLRAPFPALALAPLAVLPERQRAGIGSALVRAAHERAGAQGWSAIFLLGNPDYYSRFGYSVEAAAPYDSPYAGPHFMMLALAADRPPNGQVRHADAFGALD